MRITSESFLHGFYRKPRISKRYLAEHARGLIGLSGCLAGELCEYHPVSPDRRSRLFQHCFHFSRPIRQYRNMLKALAYSCITNAKSVASKRWVGEITTSLG